MESVLPVTVTTRSGTEPSVMWILAVESSRIELMISPPLPIIDPTSLPFMIIRRVSVIGESEPRGLESVEDMVIGVEEVEMMMEVLVLEEKVFIWPGLAGGSFLWPCGLEVTGLGRQASGLWKKVVKTLGHFMMLDSGILDF